MTFQELRNLHHFHFIYGCASHRIYDNGVYRIVVTNITSIAEVFRIGMLKPCNTFNIHSNDIKESMLIY